jgi:hypothetical protein
MEFRITTTQIISRVYTVEASSSVDAWNRWHNELTHDGMAQALEQEYSDIETIQDIETA